MSVDARIESRRGTFRLEADFAVGGGTTVVFGASGSGKTSLLRAIAGLDPARGRLCVGGEMWLDSATKIGWPAHARPVGYVFQHANLLPHLTVAGNLDYGARRASGEGPDRDEVVRWVGLERLLTRGVEGLSGGERQRVALARALLRRPRLLLLDEPLSSLDEPTRRGLLPLLARVADRFGVPMLFVTHRLDEALRLGDSMIWLDEGRVRHVGPLADVTTDEAFVRWRADDAGVVVDGRVAEHVEADHLWRLDGPWGPVWVGLPAGRARGEAVRLRILARDVSLARTAERDSTLLNQFPMRVVGLDEGDPGEVTVRLTGLGDDASILLARVTTRSVRRLGLAVGDAVHARVKAVAVLA